MDGSGLGVLAVGLLLCFVGVRSLPLAVLACGFGLGWLLAEVLGAGFATSLVVAGAAAVTAWFVATFVFRAALFFVGAMAGAVVGAKLFGLIEGGGGNIVLAVLFVPAVAFLAGLATQRFRTTAVAAVCALGGAGLVLSGIARAFPAALGFLRVPHAPWEVAVAAAAWIVLAGAGWVVQRTDRKGVPG